MAIIQEREIARADMNDEYGVDVWQERKLTSYSPEAARDLAREILHAADEADRVHAEDAKAAFGDHECRSFPVAPGGESAL